MRTQPLKFLKAVLIVLLMPLIAFPFKDEKHFSKTFNEIRYFRVFTPPDYNPADTTKRYPVIYYFHGCGGSYRKSGTYSYEDYGLTAPKAVNRPWHPDYAYPNNADFENFTRQHDAIIVSVDGKITGMPKGCQVYFPSQTKDWKGNYYNFSAYIRELIEVVDARYNTKKGPQFRAVSGLSMGGQMAVWVAATNPHLFSSASEFCHSPSFYDVGDPRYQTTIDLRELWRNLRGLPFRHSTNTGDYLKYYTEELYADYSGAGFEDKFYMTNFCKHHAARIDLQFEFHMDHFTKAKGHPPCFSFINLYPDFEVWGYRVESNKTGNGWIYLHDVTKNGMGIYTRRRPPFGKSLPPFDITVTTPPVYAPGADYKISRYSYYNHDFSSEPVKADPRGRLKITAPGGPGEEIGIIGNGLPPPVFILTDTINENIYLDDGEEKTSSFDIINLSDQTQTIDFKVTSMDENLVRITGQPASVTVPAKSKTNVNPLLVCKGTFQLNYRNSSFIRISYSIDGKVQKREQFIRVTVKKPEQTEGSFRIQVFDGRTEELPLYQYQWGKWNHPLSPGTITEGCGNGNGKAETGEIFSIWIQTPSPFNSTDTATWHPCLPVNEGDNPDIIVEDIVRHRFNTGRSVLSAQLRLTRKPTRSHPVKIPVQVEFLKAQPLENDCHRNTADDFTYAWYNLMLKEDGSVVLVPKHY